MPNDQPTYDEIRRVLGVPPEDFDDDQLKVLRTIAAGMQWFRSVDIRARGLAEAVDAEFEAAARRRDAAPDSTRASPGPQLLLFPHLGD